VSAVIDGLAIRRRLGRELWRPPQAFGPDGFFYRAHGDGRSSVIVTAAPTRGLLVPDTDWVHASIAHHDRMPSYDELVALHRAVFDDGWAYQCFTPAAEHVDIHPYALHLWGRADGQPALPDFTDGMGTI